MTHRSFLTGLAWSGPWSPFLPLFFFCSLHMLGLFLLHNLSLLPPLPGILFLLELYGVVIGDWFLLMIQDFSFLANNLLIVSLYHLLNFRDSTYFSLKLTSLFVYVCLVCRHLHVISMRARTFCFLIMADLSAYNIVQFIIGSQ